MLDLHCNRLRAVEGLSHLTELRVLNLAGNLLGPSQQPPQAYRDSLETFIDRCGIRELIAAARAEIGEEPINTRIKAMHPDEISRNRSIWSRTFRGTRFLKLLEKRSRKSSLENDA